MTCVALPCTSRVQLNYLPTIRRLAVQITTVMHRGPSSDQRRHPSLTVMTIAFTLTYSGFGRLPYFTFLARRSLLIEQRKRYWNKSVAYPICLSVCLSVSLSVWKVYRYCGKMAYGIWMPFGVVSGVSRGMGVLVGGGDRRRGRAVSG